MKLRIRILSYWPIALLLFIELILFAANYTPDTFLIGWDNVMPEFNFKANLTRNIFGVWQEHRGLGLYDGLSHAANTLHTLLLWALSFILPLNLIRYSFTFLMHFTGGIGVYLLLKSLTKSKKTSTLISLVGSAFYLLNFATVQMFFTPLESFSIHFAGLPWLGLTLTNFLKNPTKKTLLGFYIVTFLATAQFFVATLVVPTVILLIVISLHFLFTHRLHRSSVKQAITAGVGFILINSFWLFPYLFGLPKNAPIIQAAKINQHSSVEIFSRNQAFGDLKNVLLLRGFMFDAIDLLPDGSTGPMMAPWRNHLDTPLTLAAEYSLAGLMLLGVLFSLIKKDRQYIPFIILLAIGFFMLGNDISALREVNEFLRERIPLFSEAFRFPFTKFSLLFALSFAVLMSAGLGQINNWLRIRFAHFLVVTIVLIFIFYNALPGYMGNFISSSMRQKLPPDYLSLFTYMKDLDRNGRITILPQPSHWSWKQYRWGYTGSGFIWYGVDQPILDRAFDPWSRENENYYWELSHALYTKESTQLESVLRKYSVRYIVLDEYLVSSTSSLGLYIEQTKDLLSAITAVHEMATFGKLKVYEYTQNEYRNHIAVKGNMPLVSPSYNWTDNDIAYRELQDYINKSSTADNDRSLHYYPFRSFFTKRSVAEREFILNESDDVLILSTTHQGLLAGHKSPQSVLDELVSPLEFSASSSATVAVDEKQVQVFIPKKDQLVFDSTATQSLTATNVIRCGVMREGPFRAENITVSKEAWLRLVSINQRACLSFGIPDAEHRYGYVLAVANRNITGRPVLFSVINQTARHVELESYLPNRLASEENGDWQTTYFVLPPIARDGIGYTIYLANDSIGRHESINEIGHVYMYKIPYEQLVRLSFALSSNYQIDYSNSITYSVDHPNPAEYWLSYKLESNYGQQRTLILSQSFHPGWMAYDVSKCQSGKLRLLCGLFPYLLGNRLTDHVQVNNWANGWNLDQVSGCRNQVTEISPENLKPGTCNLNFYIFFWPQILQFFGFGLMILPFLLLMRLKKQI